MSEPVWSPSPDRVQQANLTSFRRFVSRSNGVSLADYDALYQWSVDHPAEFWTAIWDFAGVVAQRPWDAVLEDGDRMPGARWFRGAELNFAENLLRHRDNRDAIVSWNENGRGQAVSFAELRGQVARLADALSRWGVRRGDRVAGFLPNIPETVIAMLAATSLGAVWSSCSPDFGLQGLVDRFGQIEPKVLVAAAGYQYAGKRQDCRERITCLRDRIPSIEKIVLVPYLGDSRLEEGCVLWNSVMEEAEPPLRFEPVPFDHPVYILYSSGTTGVPKCIVHGAGGTLLQHCKELILHTDLRPGDRISYFTTCGWMMWNWLVSSLVTGAAIVLYDGSPFHPSPEALFTMAARERVSVFGASAKFFAALEKAGVDLRGSGSLSYLRTILSTGSPLAPESFDYIYRAIKPDVCLSSISGGTDIVSCFALGNPAAPVYRGEIQTRGLGMKVEVWDDEGQPVQGQKGELVCSAPFPSMPVGFWNDPGGEKYRRAYFEHFPGVWRHGDYAELTPHGGMIIHGRSDAVLNPGGVRIGTAEIYRIVEQLSEIQECLAVGQEWEGDVRVILFVRLMDGCELTEDLRQTIRQRIRREASPRHVPAKIIPVEDIPRTVSGKITELAVRDMIHGRPVKNVEALANPAALECYRDLPELRQ